MVKRVENSKYDLPSGAPSHTTKSAFSPSKCAITCVPESIVSGLQGLMPAVLTGRCTTQKKQTALVPGTHRARQQSDEDATQNGQQYLSCSHCAGDVSLDLRHALNGRHWLQVNSYNFRRLMRPTRVGQSGHNAVIERNRIALSTHLLCTHALAYAGKAPTRHSPAGLDGRQVQLSA